jgi:hypothetical protein
MISIRADTAKRTRREVDPPIAVVMATWTPAGQLVEGIMTTITEAAIKLAQHLHLQQSSYHGRESTGTSPECGRGWTPAESLTTPSRAVGSRFPTTGPESGPGPASPGLPAMTVPVPELFRTRRLLRCRAPRVIRVAFPVVVAALPSRVPRCSLLDGAPLDGGS